MQSSKNSSLFLEVIPFGKAKFLQLVSIYEAYKKFIKK